MRIYILMAIVLLIVVIFWLTKVHPKELSYFDKLYTPESFGTLDHVKVQKGLNAMKKSKVVIAGLIRDGAHRVPIIKKNIMKLANAFESSTILIVENDSSDDTRQQLLKWTTEDANVVVLGCGTNARQCHLNLARTEGHSMQRDRIVKMAYLRNIYLDYTLINYSDFDYLIVIDLDLFGYPYLDGIATSFYYLSNDDKRRSIDGIAANGLLMSEQGRFFYYDPFAYRPLGKKFDFDSEEEKNEWDKTVFAYAFPKVGTELMQVQSAFAGLAIYRIPNLLINRAKYYPPQVGKYGCEHVHFHKFMKGLYINPNMVYAIFDNSPL